MEKDIGRYLAENDVGIHVFDDSSKEEESFLAWFDQKVLGLDSEEYRRSFWREVRRTGHTIGHYPQTWDEFVRRHCVVRSEETGLILAVGLLACLTYSFWIVRKVIDIHLARTRRSLYYESERARRRALAAERRAIKIRRTVNSKPSLCEIRTAYTHVHDSPLAALRLGALLEDLECYVDNHAFMDESGQVRGRAGGIKRLFEAEAPDLFCHYKHIMSYKARAKRYRQACGAAAPVPEDALLPIAEEPANAPDGTAENSVPPKAYHAKRQLRFPERPELASVEALTAWMANHGNTAYLRTQSWVTEPERIYTESDLLSGDSHRLAAEILSFGNGTLIALDAAIALKIDPECVPEVLPDGATARQLPTGGRPPRIARRVLDWIRRFRASELRTAG